MAFIIDQSKVPEIKEILAPTSPVNAVKVKELIIDDRGFQLKTNYGNFNGYLNDFNGNKYSRQFTETYQALGFVDKIPSRKLKRKMFGEERTVEVVSFDPPKELVLVLKKNQKGYYDKIVKVYPGNDTSVVDTFWIDLANGETSGEEVVRVEAKPKPTPDIPIDVDDQTIPF